MYMDHKEIGCGLNLKEAGYVLDHKGTGCGLNLKKEERGWILKEQDLD
jgi:hypothetical protein